MLNIIKKAWGLLFEDKLTPTSRSRTLIHLLGLFLDKFFKVFFKLYL